MSLEMQFSLVAVLSFVGAALTETVCWMMLARRDMQRMGVRVWVGVLATCVVGATTAFGMSGSELTARLLGSLGLAAGYAYMRWRLRIPDLLIRLGLHLAGTEPVKAAGPHSINPTRPRRNEYLVAISVVMIVMGPVVASILYPEVRLYALLWTAVVAVPAGIILWRRFTASARR